MVDFSEIYFHYGNFCGIVELKTFQVILLLLVFVDYVRGSKNRYSHKTCLYFCEEFSASLTDFLHIAVITSTAVS